MEELSIHITQLLINKDEQAIDLIYDHYGDNLYGYILKIVTDEQMAQDVLQESFIKIWKYSDKYDPKKSRLFTWLMNICRNLAIDKLRASKRYLTDDIQKLDSGVYNFKVSQINIDQIDLREKVNGLETKYKVIIEVLFFKGMTQREASDYLEVPLGTVKSRLKIALRELNRIFQFRKNEINIFLVVAWMIR